MIDYYMNQLRRIGHDYRLYFLATVDPTEFTVTIQVPAEVGGWTDYRVAPLLERLNRLCLDISDNTSYRPILKTYK